MSWKITQWGLSLQATTIWSIVDLKISSDIRPVQLRPTGAAKAITFLYFIHNWLWAHRANATWWLHCLYSHSCWALCIHSHHMMHIDRQLAQSEGEREREKFLNELRLKMTEPARALSFTQQIGPKPKKGDPLACGGVAELWTSFVRLLHHLHSAAWAKKENTTLSSTCLWLHLGGMKHRAV